MSSTLDQPTVTVPERARRAAEAPAARLHVVHPPALAATHALPTTHPVQIGRGRGPGQITVAHRTASRRHVGVEWDRGRGCHVVTDLDSHNGTRVDGAPAVGPTPLADGAVLRLGEVIAVYERGDGIDAPDIAEVPGEALAVRWLRASIARAAGDPSAVVVLGETGTGKEFVARALHRLGGRSGALVPLNCATLTAHLAEAQLFGVRARAVSAVDAQPGAFGAADGGSLLLDEIGELPLTLQPKLLRVLQEGEITPLGASRPVDVDVRVIAATHRDLATRVEDGRFRRDLYARLSLWVLEVPPLRARRGDIPGWIDRLHRRWLDARGRSGAALVFEAAAMERLLLAPWPDNLRGLDRLVHRFAGQADPVSVDALPTEVTPGEAPTAAEPSPTLGPGERPTREALAALLEETGSVRATARALGRDRKQIYRWMQSYGLK